MKCHRCHRCNKIINGKAFVFSGFLFHAKCWDEHKRESLSSGLAEEKA